MVNGQTWRPPWVRDRLDALVTLHDELGVSAASGEITCARQRGGIDDEPLLRTTAVLPSAESSLSESAEQLFGSRRSCCAWAGLRYSCSSAPTSGIVIPGATADLPVLSPRHTARRVCRVSEDVWLQVQRSSVHQFSPDSWCVAGLCDRRFRVERPMATPIPAFRRGYRGESRRASSFFRFP